MFSLPPLGHGGDVQVAVQHFDIGAGFDLAGGHFAGLVDTQADGLDAIVHHLERNLLQVQDDVGRVFDHARESG